jgi:hypothetical protein
MKLKISVSLLPSLFLLPLVILFYRVLPILLSFKVVTAFLRLRLQAQRLSESQLLFATSRFPG